MKKKFLLISVILGLALMVNLVTSLNVNASTDSINEKFGQPIVVYGETLNEDQKQQVRELLNIDDPSQVQELIVTAEDLVNYINGDPSANMYSSAKITRKEDGNGLNVTIVNPENITEVTKEMYANALLTAGIENAEVEVASPLKVSGHSALTGIYKAYNVDGESLDQDRMEVANEELGVATDLAEQEGLDQAKVSELLTAIKQAIAEQNPATKEDVERIIQEQLDRLNIELNQDDLNRLIELFEKMRSINIDFDQVTNQLNDLANTIKDRIQEVAGDKGFWESVGNFFRNIFQAIANLFN
ncbi:DUF1002 domain-containing protein [Radiobacillus sp. PE A8.2]|uniref:DUF1002 domain-containing protein n=1 Tax=Radiobacillus sp. PE A8.2 TaxID=3380349 RepID=UPI00388D7A25